MAALHELEAELTALVQERHENIEDLTTKQRNEYREKIKGVRAQIQDILTAGADPCPECGLHPVGINQPTYFEVGCITPTCSDPKLRDGQLGRRSKGKTIEEAVNNWNQEVYFAPPAR